MNFLNTYSHMAARVFGAAWAAILLSAGTLSNPAFAQDMAPNLTAESTPHDISHNRGKTKRRIVTHPVPSVKNIHRVVASKTPSGFEVPRYVSLKFSKFNGRSGPSQNHPIVWQYRRSGLPVIVVAETENWRKIRDMAGDESWVHKAGLSGERYVVSLGETPLMKRPNPAAYVTAVAETQALLRMESCEENWCRVFSKDGHRGWAHQDNIWGARPLF